VLQCVAVCCSVLQYVAVMAVLLTARVEVRNTNVVGILQHGAVCYSMLQYVALFCSVLQRRLYS